MTRMLSKQEQELKIIQAREKYKTPTIGQIATQSKNDLQSTKEKNKSRRLFFPSLEKKQFAELLKIEGTAAMARRDIPGQFVIHDDNRELIRQLYYYFIGDQTNFFGDLKKGWHVYGDFGTGKTITMEAAWIIYLKLHGIDSQNILPAKEVGDKARQFGYEYFRKRPFFFDDIRREEREINVFGNKTKPMIEIFHRRYNAGTKSKTWTTSQWSIDGLAEVYGQAITTRMKQMLNEFEMQGKNLRK